MFWETDDFIKYYESKPIRAETECVSSGSTHVIIIILCLYQMRPREALWDGNYGPNRKSISNVIVELVWVRDLFPWFITFSHIWLQFSFLFLYLTSLKEKENITILSYKNSLNSLQCHIISVKNLSYLGWTTWSSSIHMFCFSSMQELWNEKLPIRIREGESYCGTLLFFVRSSRCLLRGWLRPSQPKHTGNTSNTCPALLQREGRLGEAQMLKKFYNQNFTNQIPEDPFHFSHLRWKMSRLCGWRRAIIYLCLKKRNE